MRFSAEESESRREFFRAVGRYGLMAALAAAAALTIRRETPGGQRCVNRGICAGCAVFEGCAMPQALSARQAQNPGVES
jgi:hypothetical protein